MSNRFCVGDYLVEPDLNCIFGPDAERQIEPKAGEVLVYLVAHAGEVVGKEQLIRAVWQDTFVADGALWQCIPRLREVFGDDPKSPSYIQTVARRGYVLIAEVKEPEESQTSHLELKRRNPRNPWIGWVPPLPAAALLVWIAWYWKTSDTEPEAVRPKHEQMTFTGQAHSPAISPDGRSIVYFTGQNLFLRDRAGETTIEILSGDKLGSYFDPLQVSWSPDGSKILASLYLARDDGPVNLVFPRLGGEGRSVGSSLLPAWSPDGTQLAALGSSLWVALRSILLLKHAASNHLVGQTTPNSSI